MKKKSTRAGDPANILNHTLADLESHLADLYQYEREEQEQLAEMMSPEYTSKDGLYEGQTFAGARDSFIRQHLQDLESLYDSIRITKAQIEKMKGTKSK